MKYLFEHYNKYYFKRKIQNKIICISLKSRDKDECQFLIDIINSRLNILRGFMDFNKEIEYIQELLKNYVKNAKEEYSMYADIRKRVYKHEDYNGKHPKALNHWIHELEDMIYWKYNVVATRALLKEYGLESEIDKMSKEAQTVFAESFLKKEANILKFDLQNSQEFIHGEKELGIEELAKSNLKRDKYEIYNDYIENVKDIKKNMLDKVEQPILTFLQSSNKKYLCEYSLKDYRTFFISLIYTPARFKTYKKLYEDYQKNFVLIASDFKDSIESGENLFMNYTYELKLQSFSNIKEKLFEFDNFLDDCISNGYISKNVYKNNSNFNLKNYRDILSESRKRVPFNSDEINKMFSLYSIKINDDDFDLKNFYIPVISLFSGLRLEEICKLRVADIKQENEIYYFDIVGDVKTDNSLRKVPIHSYLINKFKFLDYVNSKQSNEFLFDLTTIKYKGKVKHSHYFARDFFNDLKDDFVDNQRAEEYLISFHSFRHFHATALHKGNVPFYNISQILGHSVDTVLKKFFNIKKEENETPTYVHADLEDMKKDIEKLNLNSINFDKIERYFKKNLKVT